MEVLMARNRPPNKAPEITEEDRHRYTKGRINVLEKEIKLLKNRVRILERDQLKYKKNEEKVPKKIKEKPRQGLTREELLKKYHPDHRSDDE